MDHGADLNIRSKSNKSPLHIAVESDNVEIVKLLLDKGEDVNSIRTVPSTASFGLVAPIRVLIALTASFFCNTTGIDHFP